MTDDALPEPRSLDQSTALIVGGTSGIGLETARQLLASGCRVAIAGRSAERGLAALGRLTGLGDIMLITGDASTVEGCAAISAQAEHHLGRVDVLVNSTIPAILPDLFHRTPVASIPATLTGIALPSMLMTAAVLSGMRQRRGGVIVNIASDAGKVATPGEAVIGAAMAAIIMFSRAVAMEAKRDGVRVNVLTPSLVSGTETSERILKEGFSAKLFGKAAAMAGLGVAEPADIAAMIVFLASPAARRLTGQAISVNGGISAA